MVNSDIVTVTAATARVGSDVLRERYQQVLEHGYTPERDDGHQFHELAEAAIAHVRVAIHQQRAGVLDATTVARHHWPWQGKPMPILNPRSALVTAAALILAEIERQDRLQQALIAGGAQD